MDSHAVLPDDERLAFRCDCGDEIAGGFDARVECECGAVYVVTVTKIVSSD